MILVLKKTASLFLGIFSIFFLPHGMIIRLAPEQALQPVFHVKAGTGSTREDAPDAPLALSHHIHHEALRLMCQECRVSKVAMGALPFTGSAMHLPQRGKVRHFRNIEEPRRICFRSR